MSIAVAASFMLLVPSCAVFQNNTSKKVTGDSGKVTAVAGKSEKTSSTKNTSVSKVKNDSSKPQPAKSNKTPEAAQSSEPQVVVSSASGSELNGEWTMMKVQDKKLTGDDRPYIYFDEKTGRFYGSNTCNIINGEYKTSPNGGLHFNSVITTMKMCQDTPYEFIINSALDQVNGYRIDKTGDEETLSLLNKSGHVMLVLNRHNTDFLNGAWKVVSIDGTTVTADNMKFALDVPELKIHGNAGCNILNGTLLVDPDVPNSIQFQNLSTSRMTCPDIQQETALLVALEEVTSAYRYGDSGVVLRNNSGKDKIVLQRIDRSEL